MRFLLISIFSVSLVAQSAIVGTDDRYDMHEVHDKKILELSKSTPALILKSALKKTSDGNYQSTQTTLGKRMKMCSDAKFQDQPSIANCSAALIGKDKVLTAAHCFDDSSYSFLNYYVVFDYKNTTDVNYKIKKENVFEISELIYSKFDKTFTKTGEDIAIIKLTKATNRRPLKINFNSSYEMGTNLFLLGYPLGTPLKLSTNGTIIESGSNTLSFKHNLDCFSVNSGSPIFNANTYEIIGVNVRGLGSNYSKYGRTCNDWSLAKPGHYDEGNKLAHISHLLP